MIIIAEGYSYKYRNGYLVDDNDDDHVCGGDYVSELLSLTGLLFISQVM
jgi:hypothetical protein